MNKYLLLLFISVTSELFGQTTFQKTYTIDQAEWANYFIPTADGGFSAAGSCLRIGDSRSQIYFLRADSNSNIIASESYGSDFEHRSGSCIQQCLEGGFIITGYSQDNSIAGNYAFLMRIDELGQIIWIKIFGDIHDNFGNSVTQTTDSGFILVGSTLNYTTSSYNLFVVRTDSVGDTLWTREFYSGNNSVGNSIHQTFDGGFIITARINNNISLIKIAASGNLLWAKSFTGYSDGYVTSFLQTSDSGFVLTGFIQDSVTSYSKIFLMRTNSSGDTLWAKRYGGNKHDVATSVSQTADAGFILAGYTSSFGVMDTDIYVIRTHSNGDTIWTKTYGDSLEDMASSVFQTYDGGFMIGGNTQSFGGLNKTYVIKTDTAGTSGCNERDVQTIVYSQQFSLIIPVLTSSSGSIHSDLFISSLPGGVENNLCSSVSISENISQENLTLISPNPFTNEIILHVPEVESSKEISILELTGKEILRQKLFGTENKVNTEGLSSGLYLFRYFDGKSYAHLKIIKQ